MTSSLDLNILPLCRQAGQELPDLPDLYAANPPRRTAHGRATDSLILYLSMAGNAPLSPEQHSQLMTRLSEKFYKTSGSVTAAMRTVADALNLHLLDRNLRITSSGQQGIGVFTIAVLHGDALYLAHCGPAHAFLVTPSETQEIHDPQGAGRGLGLSRTTSIRFFQVPLQAGDYLVISAQPPSGWNPGSLKHSQRLGMEGMRRQLIDYGTPEMRAAIIQAQSGEGRLRLLRRKPGLPDMARPEKVEAETVTLPPKVEVPVPPVTLPPAEKPSPPAASATAEPAEAGVKLRRPPVGRSDKASAVPAPAAKPTTTPQPSRIRAEKRASSRKGVKELLAPASVGFAAIGRALGNTLSAASHGLGRLLKNMLPDESLLHLPPSVMVFFALAVPLVISAVGGMVYIQRGRAAQHQSYYEQAMNAAAEAIQQSNPNLQRSSWQAVLQDLDKAEFYKVTSDSQSLRTQASNALDELNGVQRLDFQPAIIGGLGKEVKVARLVATPTDLYMLNGAQGSVLRAILTGSGFEIDTKFTCGPSYGQTVVGPLVDIVALPTGLHNNATLLGMDANGSLLYCTPAGVQAEAEALAPPLTNFGEPQAVTLDNNDLYVLDPKANAVWIYRDMNTAQQPHLFFGTEIPPMADVIDLAVNNDDLFLLHADGHITKCTYNNSRGSPTRCDDPFPYQDTRPGLQDGAILGDAVFSQIYYSPPPDPSIYMLAPQGQSVFHFSVRLAFQRQLGAATRLPAGRATAFAVSSNRLVFLAISNEVFYAALP